MKALPTDWTDIDTRLRKLSRRRAHQDYLMGKLLLAALRVEVYVHLGLASIAEYAERVLGFDGRMTAERLRVAKALEELHETASALRRGRLSWSAVRELTRVAVPETEAAWLAAAAGKRVRQIEEMASGLPAGALPGATPDPTQVRKVIRIELENAVSVAGVLLLTEATLTDVPEPEPRHENPDLA